MYKDHAQNIGVAFILILALIGLESDIAQWILTLSVV